MERSMINKVTKPVVDVFFFIGIVCVICVPFLTNRLWYDYDFQKLTFMKAVLFTSGICAVFILYNLRIMLKTLTGGNPFVKDNIACFNRMALAALMIALIYAIKCFVIFSFATVVIVCVFAMAALFCLTLKEVFCRAVEYKEENDWIKKELTGIEPINSFAVRFANA